MNRRDFARSAAAALAAGAGSGAAFAQAGSDPDSMVDYDAAAAIELPALAASGIAVIGANGVDTIVAPWTENGERVRRLQEAAQRGDLATRSTIIAGPLPGWTPPQVAKNYWQTGFQRPPAIWPRDERASDYRHLSTRSIGNQLVGGFQRSTDAGFELSGATFDTETRHAHVRPARLSARKWRGVGAVGCEAPHARGHTQPCGHALHDRRVAPGG